MLDKYVIHCQKAFMLISARSASFLRPEDIWKIKSFSNANFPDEKKRNDKFHEYDTYGLFMVSRQRN